MNCLFCNKEGAIFNTVEHIIPESLGNDDLLLEGNVCDKCQNYLSQNENYILSRTPIGFWRTLLSIPTKKNKRPSVDFSKADATKGLIPDYHPANDNVVFQAHDDFTTELIPNASILTQLNQEGKGQAKYIFTPKAIYEIGRFLGKIGLELICKMDPATARNVEFDAIRKFVRQGSLKDLWPVFHANQGTINDLFSYKINNGVAEEEITCYSYSMNKVDTHYLLNLVIGTDSWFLCLNNQFPGETIMSGLSGDGMKILWYPKEQWRKS